MSVESVVDETDALEMRLVGARAAALKDEWNADFAIVSHEVHWPIGAASDASVDPGVQVAARKVGDGCHRIGDRLGGLFLNVVTEDLVGVDALPALAADLPSRSDPFSWI